MSKGVHYWLRMPLLGVIAALILSACQDPVSMGPGIHAPDVPLQTERHGATIALKDFELRPRADFAITAKLLAKRRYHFDDLAAVVPWDFALAWGPLSDEANLVGTKITQGGRKMYWHLYDTPLRLSLVERSSANMHLIPASPGVAETLAAAPRGAIVALKGELVDLVHPDGRITPTSMTRLDRGAGACEILLVSEARTHLSGDSTIGD